MINFKSVFSHCCLTLFVAFAANAQVQVPRDTSFTLYGTYIKEKKYRPYIRIAEPELKTGVLVKKDLVYSDLNGRKLLVDVYCPQNRKQKYPGVVLIFGGGWRSGDKSQMEAMGRVLAAKGYVAFAPEYRLSLEAIYPAAVYDLKQAVRWMRLHHKEFNLDVSKIASLGTSAGGQLAALLGTTNHDERFEADDSSSGASSAIQAIVDIDGTLAFHHPESVEGKAASWWFGGDYQQKPELWEDAAPLNHVDKNTAPILFVNSSLPRFHAGRDDMVAKLDSLQIYSQVKEFPDTPHPFWFFHPWFDPMMETVVDFLDKQFK
ncbi:esterase [Pelobium manganitolerans]|uniref:Esterase n=1 Tax=Pelobium manganitolerans TaxID=1842495 RepID=A0A419S702_9SPHI|nr:alpha/beta hydrolase [Pelobium manganitolerans]RKD17147.1 esterase [Pelobium manganitolerans]